MNDDPNRDVSVFTEALRLAPEERAAFLECACGNDRQMRDRMKALLRTHEQVGDFLELPPQNTSMEARAGGSVGEKPGDWIGHYKLLQQVGEGGCGVVFMAEQEEPVRRKVALKIIKPGMDTRSVIARFEAERQVLALMDHPSIAKVFDAGATESGRPYFVMELIRGVKITEYCDQNSLTTEERLKLFVQVCQAVQHAHQKGIIHRDIKPSNILVSNSLEGAPLPVVIDFGIAKATTNQPLTDKTLFTAFEMLIGTPAYMSPEQAELTRVDVDTRTDIYSLGVLLYELLTGLTPFDTTELLKSGLDEVRRVIREQEPLRPSTKLSGMAGADLTTVAQHRKSEPPRLIRVVSGDLDWIVMKALEKDRTRRYETANGLALDVQRFLADEAIAARPPSKLYRLRKTVLRNKILFGGIAVIAALLAVSLAVVTTSLGREKKARFQAQTEETVSRQVTQFLKSMLEGVGPSVARGRDTEMLREILDRTSERIGNDVVRQPAVEAELRSLIGRLYLEIGNYAGAEKMQRATLAIHRKLDGPQSAQAATALNDLGLALFKGGNPAESERVHIEALAIRRRLFGNGNPVVAASLNNLAVVYRYQHRFVEAESLIREALAIRRKLFGNEHLEVADSLHNLSYILNDQGKRAEAEATARELLAMRRRLLGNDDPLVASALTDVAWVTAWSGNLAEADSLNREALAMRRKLLGEEHPDVAKTIAELGEIMTQQGKLAEGHVVLSAAISIQRKLLGEDNPDTLDSLDFLGWILEAEGKWAEAEKVHRGAMTLWRKRAGIAYPQALGELAGLVRALVAQEKFEEAERAVNETLSPELLGNPLSADVLVSRIDLRGRRGRWKEAIGDAALALQYQPAEHYRYHVLAGLLAITQDRPAYEQLCGRIISTFSSTTNAYVAERIAGDCLLLPHSGTDLRLVDKLADAAVSIGRDNLDSLPYFHACKALSCYRLARFTEAVQWAEKALNSSIIYARAKACAVIALANWQLGRKEDGRAMLAKGNALAPPVQPGRGDVDLGNAWVAWLFARVTLDEAAELIESSPNQP